MSVAPLLTVLRDGEAIHTLPVESEALVGRGENCVLRLVDRAISREHALFRRVGGAIQVERRSHFAPLVVNGAECTTAVLKEGDVISLGPYLIRLSLGKEAAASDRQPGSATSTSEPAQVIPINPEARPSDAAPLEFTGGAGGLSALGAGPTQPVIEPAATDELERGNRESSAGATAFEISDSPLSGASSESTDAGPLQFESPLQAVETAGTPASEVGPPTTSGNGGGQTRETSMGALVASLKFNPGDANVTEYRIEKDEVVIGRGKDCDIILTDKRSSRRHSLIIREGSVFKVRDLGSSNGTFVNGVAVTEHVLSGGDRIRIGEADFTFNAVQAGYEEQARNLPSAAELAGDGSMNSAIESFDLAAAIEGGGSDADGGRGPSEILSDSHPIALLAGDSPVEAEARRHGGGVAAPRGAPGVSGIPGIPGMGGVGASLPHGKETLLEKFKRQPRPRQILIVLLIFLGALWYFGDDQAPVHPVKKPAPAQVAAATGATGGTGAAAAGDQAALKSFNSLTPEQQRFVEMQHDLAFNYYRNKQYDEALVEIEKIFSLVDDYKNSRDIERYAKEGKRKLEALAEEKRKQEAEADLRKKVADALAQARELMANKKYQEASDVFARILSLDPENQEVAELQRQLAQIEEDEKVEAQKQAVRQEVNRQAWIAAEQAARLKKEGKLHAALREFKRIEALGPTDVRLRRLVRLEISRCQTAIARALAPLLSEARQSEDSGDFIKAFDLYDKAGRLDPGSRVVRDATDRIRKVLHERAKALYTEAILAESYSDFSAAKKKYADCLRTAPSDDIYYDRARRKLSHYFDEGEDDSSQ